MRSAASLAPSTGFGTLRDTKEISVRWMDGCMQGWVGVWVGEWIYVYEHR